MSTWLAGPDETWRGRDLSEKPIKHLFVGGMLSSWWAEGFGEKIPALSPIGVAVDRGRILLGLQAEDKEFAFNLREFFNDLKRRSLDGSNGILGIKDDLPGFALVFIKAFPIAKVRR